MLVSIISSNQESGRLSRSQVNQLIDLDRYPIDQLESDAGRDLIEICHNNLATQAIALLPGFIRPNAISEMAEETQSLVNQAYRYDQPRSAFYEHPNHHHRVRDGDNWSTLRSKRHPNRYCQILNYQIPNNSNLRAIYLWPKLTEFVRRVLDVNRLYPSVCPHLALTMKVAYEGDLDGWHYDPNDGVITLMLQPSESGGEFEYAPYIRNEQEENYTEVKRLFDSPDTESRRIKLEAGTFTLFNGRFSMHRVRPVGPTKQPRIVAIFSYDERPDMVFSQDYIDMLRSFPQGPPDRNSSIN
jgi:hypothetical protein